MLCCTPGVCICIVWCSTSCVGVCVVLYTGCRCMYCVVLYDVCGCMCCGVHYVYVYMVEEKKKHWACRVWPLIRCVYRKNKGRRKGPIEG